MIKSTSLGVAQVTEDTNEEFEKVELCPAESPSPKSIEHNTRIASQRKEESTRYAVIKHAF